MQSEDHEEWATESVAARTWAGGLVDDWKARKGSALD